MAGVLGIPQDQVVPLLYAVYYDDFVKHRCRYGRLAVRCDSRCLPGGDGLPEGFWHLVTRDYKGQGARALDFQRAMRLPWCAPTIGHHTDASVRAWRHRESRGEVRTYIWLEALDYAIVLQVIDKPSGHFARLITAFHVDGDSQRRSLKQKYDRRVQ